MLTVAICTIPTLIDTYKDEVSFPLPPNRECIESVEMVLNIPIAVDYFYEFLLTQRVQQAMNCFSLYIDLRMYDNSCTESPEDKGEIAEKIY